MAELNSIHMWFWLYNYIWEVWESPWNMIIACVYTKWNNRKITMCLKQIFFWLIVLGLIQIILWKKIPPNENMVFST